MKKNKYVETHPVQMSATELMDKSVSFVNLWTTRIFIPLIQICAQRWTTAN